MAEKVVLITGSSSGIGLLTTVELARTGFRRVALSSLPLVLHHSAAWPSVPSYRNEIMSGNKPTIFSSLPGVGNLHCDLRACYKRHREKMWLKKLR